MKQIRYFLVLIALLALPSCAAFVEYSAAAGIKCDNPCKPKQQTTAQELRVKEAHERTLHRA